MEQNEIDIGRIFRMVLMHSKLVVLGIVTFSVVGIINYIYTTKEYRIDSLLHVIPEQRSLGSEIDIILGTQNTTDLEVVKDLYVSRTNIIKLIEEKYLNISINDELISNAELINEYVAFLGKNQTQQKAMINLDENSYGLVVGDSINENSLQYGKTYDFREIKLNLNKIKNYGQVEITYTNPELLYNTVKSKFSISSSTDLSRFYGLRNTGLLTVSYRSDFPNEGKLILDHANNIFISKNIESEAETARKAIDFIDKRLIVIEEILEKDKRNLKEFREDNRTVNVDKEINTIIDNVSLLEKELNELEIEIAAASISYTETNPFYLDLLQKREILLVQKKQVDDQIKKLPLSQQEYIDLFKELELSQNEYNSLLQNKLDLSIKEASTIGNIRVVDNAFIFGLVEPKILDVVIFIAFGAFLSVVTAIIRGIYFTPISNPAELPDSSIQIPIFGVIPKIEDDEHHAISDEKFLQSIESFIVNIRSSFDSSTTSDVCKTILVTSATPENGKSFISRNLAKKMSNLGNKVLLIDLDWKRGNQHKNLGLEKISQREFHNLDKEGFEKFKVEENFYCIPKLSRLSSSFQYLYSPDFTAKFNEFKEIFDYIVLDTAPVLSVSDTSIAMTMSDLNFAIVRHGYTKINEVKQMEKVCSQIGNSFEGIVYNCYEKPSSYYGYYGLYGNYSYQYYANKYLYESYEYKNKDEN
tara:strand:- start:13747 stop:15846 length:2100 start_codon:yes stop_codon:yes gene_type:complete